MKTTEEFIKNQGKYTFVKHTFHYNSQIIEFITKTDEEFNTFALNGDRWEQISISNFAASKFNILPPNPVTLIIAGKPGGGVSYRIDGRSYKNIMRNYLATGENVIDVFQFIHYTPKTLTEAKEIYNNTQNGNYINDISQFVVTLHKFCEWVQVLSSTYWSKAGNGIFHSVLQWKFDNLIIAYKNFNELILNIQQLPIYISNSIYDFLRICEDNIFDKMRERKLIKMKHVLQVYNCAKDYLRIYKI